MISAFDLPVTRRHSHEWAVDFAKADWRGSVDPVGFRLGVADMDALCARLFDQHRAIAADFAGYFGGKSYDVGAAVLAQIDAWDQSDQFDRDAFCYLRAAVRFTAAKLAE